MNDDMTIHEVNGGDRNWTPFERFIGRVATFLKWLFMIAAPFAFYTALNWNVQ